MNDSPLTISITTPSSPIMQFAISTKLPQSLTPPPSHSQVAGEEDPAKRTTDEPLSDAASHSSADISQDIRVQITPPHTSPAHPQREEHKEETKVEVNKKEVSWSAVLSEGEDALTDFDGDISGLLSDGEYMPSTDMERRRGRSSPVALGKLSPKGVAKEKGVAVSADPVKGSKGKGKMSPTRQPRLLPQGVAGGVALPAIKTDPALPSKGKGRLSPARGGAKDVIKGVVTPPTKVDPATLRYSDFDSETDSAGER